MAKLREYEVSIVEIPWKDIEQDVLTLPAHAVLRVNKLVTDHPGRSGYEEHSGSPRLGKIADWRKFVAQHPRKDPRGYHVREFARHYTIHWDKVDPRLSLVGHLRADSPGWGVFLTGLTGAFAGAGGSWLGRYWEGRKEEGSK